MRPAGNSNTRKPEARATLLGRCYHDSRQDRALGPYERADAVATEREHLIELRACKRRFFSRTLHFYEFSVLGGNEIEIHRNQPVFIVIEVDDRLSIENAGTDCGNQFLHRRRVEFFFPYQFSADDS